MPETLGLREVIGYILSVHGCMHPYRLSRILVLANWKAIEKNGRPIVKFSIEGFEAGFAIPEIASLKEGDDPCFQPNKEKRCLEYKCQQPSIPVNARNIIDEVVFETRDLSDIDLNKLVVHDKRYKELIRNRGFA